MHVGKQNHYRNPQQEKGDFTQIPYSSLLMVENDRPGIRQFFWGISFLTIP